MKTVLLNTRRLARPEIVDISDDKVLFVDDIGHPDLYQKPSVC